MKGGCYCGEVRYEITGDALMKAQCHCRECQYITGGGPNYFLIVRAHQLTFTRGTPKTFERDDLDDPRIRHFCGTCGTHLTTRPQDEAWVVIKVDTLDDPAGDYGGPDLAIYMKDAQPFHELPDGLPQFDERAPGR